MREMIRVRDARTAAYPFVVFVDDDAEGGYSIVWPDLPGLSSWAATLDDIPMQVRDALELWFADLDDDALVAGPTCSILRDPILETREQVPPLFDTATLAARYGVSVRQINAKAQRLGLGRMVGHSRAFTAAEAEQVRPRPTRGRPRAQEVAPMS